MTVQSWWISKTFVAEWSLTDLDGVPAEGANVVGVVTLPNLSTAAMTITAVGGGTGKYRASYDPTTAGTHAYALSVSTPVDGAEEGTFVVRRHLVGLPAITLDPSTSIGMVRLLATDIDETEPLFEDDQIAAFLAMETNVKRAAAQALEVIATSETLVSKKITTSDGLVTDGPAVAKSLLDRARLLRDQARIEVGDPGDFGLEIVEFDPIAAYRDL